MNAELNNAEAHPTDIGAVPCFMDYLDDIYFEGYAESYANEQPVNFFNEYRIYISNYSFGDKKEVC